MTDQIIKNREFDDFWDSEKDDLWAQKILDTNEDLDREI